MILLAFAVFDEKAGAYLRPFFAPTKGLAVRSFADAVNEPGSEMNKHAADYTLFKVGEFVDSTGALIGCKAENLGNALTFRTGGD